MFIFAVAIRGLVGTFSAATGISASILSKKPAAVIALGGQSLFHTSPITPGYQLDDNRPTSWPKHNEKVYPPQAPGEERRPAWICHHRANIKYSPRKMWYIAAMLRGMSIDEALKQLSFSSKKGAHIVKEVLEEAQQMAVEIENVEYKSNLWIGESFVGKGVYVKGLRRHARARYGRVEYKHCHYFVRLVEGSPPDDYNPKEPNGHEKLKEYLDNWRNRRIVLSL